MSGNRSAAAPRASADAIAYFVSGHGFGHAGRACAVIEALLARRPGLRVELFTDAPAWFFADSLGARAVRVHRLAVDVGLVQRDALHEDLDATARALDAFLPFSSRRLEVPAAAMDRLGCRLAVCDVAPLGLAAARHAGLPSVLIENFTWDWIYRAYARRQPAFAGFAAQLAPIFADVDLHVQVAPWCAPAAAALRVPPVSRCPRRSRAAVRAALGIPADAPAAMVTMGGIAWRHRRLSAPTVDGRPAWLVVPGDHAAAGDPGPRVIALPHRSSFYHPDLVHAADAVIGKLGYSTLAEVHRAGLPFGYVPRPSFPESAPLERWLRARLPHRRIDPQTMVDGDWPRHLEPLLAGRRATARDADEEDRGDRRHGSDGAERIAAAIEALIDGRPAHPAAAPAAPVRGRSTERRRLAGGE